MSLDVRSLLERLEAVHGRPRHIARFDPMDELVSCILSQHSSDASSFPAFTKLKETFLEWEGVAAAGPERLADVIRGAGLANQKSKNILRTLEIIRDRNGTYTLEPLRALPTLEARRWLMELPGVGPKTASIVLCFAMGRETVPVDTHVYRVSWRIGLIPEEIGEVKAHDLLLAIVPPDLAFRFHVALIQHGRTICKAPLPDCERCPVASDCRWFQQGGPEIRRDELKARRKR